MERIYHLVLRPLWEADPASDYRADSLETEGFIHCSFAHQVAWAANRFYPTARDLLVLEIDPSHLVSPLRVEPPAGKPADDNAELFPHIHGPLNRPAVVAVLEVRRQDGAWRFP